MLVRFRPGAPSPSIKLRRTSPPRSGCPAEAGEINTAPFQSFGIWAHRSANLRISNFSGQDWGEVFAWQTGAATSAPSFTEDRPTVKIRKDRGKTEVGWRALAVHRRAQGQVPSGRKTVVVRKLPPPRSRPEWASIGTIASTATWRKRFTQMKPGLTVPVVFPASGPPRRTSHRALYFCCYSAC